MEQMPAKVKYERRGWCKLATKAGNVITILCDCHRYSQHKQQGGYVRVTWGGRGGHDSLEAHHPDRKENEDALHLYGNLKSFNVSHLLW